MVNTGNTSNSFLDRGYVPASGRKLHILSAYSARIRELDTDLGGAGMRLNSFYDSGVDFPIYTANASIISSDRG